MNNNRTSRIMISDYGGFPNFPNNLYVPQIIYARSVIDTSGFFTALTWTIIYDSSLTGSSGLFTSMTGTNIYGYSFLSRSSHTGATAFFTNINGTYIKGYTANFI